MNVTTYARTGSGYVSLCDDHLDRAPRGGRGFRQVGLCAVCERLAEVREKAAARAAYYVIAPLDPGARPSWDGRQYITLAAARAGAQKQFGRRRDLCMVDVRIELGSGQLIEYAGPPR